MEILKGIGVTPGYAIGEAFVFEREDVLVRGRFVKEGDTEDEIARFETAVSKVTGEIDEMRDRVRGDLGDGVSGIFESYRWIVADPSFKDEVIGRIRNNRFTAEYSVDRSFKRLIRRLSTVKNPYMRQRVVDIEDLEKRFLAALSGERSQSLAGFERPVIVVGHDIAPALLASMDRRKILGIATDVGGRTSHTAIMARDYGIPAVVGLETAGLDVSAGDRVIVDGTRGLLIIDPDEGAVARYRGLEEEFIGFEVELAKKSRVRIATSDGVPVEVLANMEFPEELDVVIDNGADGVGLFRTEFLYLASDDVPSEDEHVEVYVSIVKRLSGKPFTVRTFDLGADKLMSSDMADWSRERNPALGLRGVRLYRVRPEAFRSQVAAIYRASAHGEISLMVPMVNSVEDVRWVRERCLEVQQDLKRRGEWFNPEMPVGVMMETPAAVMSADLIAREVNFFSIGTNDLVQYALAVDRSNERVAQEFEPLNPAVLRFVRRVIEVAAEYNIPVAMCGEMAGDVMLAPLLLGLGLRSFSVSPATVPELKAVLSALTLDRVSAVAAEAMRLHTIQEIRLFIDDAVKNLVPDVFRRGQAKFR
ncbi:MAG TPA: phosphoenolpyruvate--protein phosphotransferase [Planctomycetes bacterium]|nr:phosphoenolpyruvate--protein phosphotransferase [Planctomycetota bacterium]